MNNLPKSEWKKAWKQALLFLAPLVLLYVNQVTGILSLPTHIINLSDFIPSSFTLGAISLFILNRVTDIIKRFIDSN